MTEIVVKAQALDKRKGMTLGEVVEFVGRAMTLDLPLDALVKVATGFNSQIQVLQVPR